MRKIFLLLAVVILTIIIGFCTLIYLGASTELQYMDKFSERIKMYSQNGIETDISQFGNDCKVVFYLSSRDEESLQKLKSINSIIKVHSDKRISYIILWEGNIPKDAIKNAGIDEKINYTLKSGKSISKDFPNCFLVDKDNTVKLVTGFSYIDLADKLYQFEDSQDKRARVNGFIIKDLKLADRKPVLLMFVNSNCRQCLETDSALNENLENLQKKFNLVSIRHDFDGRIQKYDKQVVTDYSLVYFGAYKNILKVSNYPLFVVLKSDSNEIDDIFTDVNGLITYIQ